jgi:hypothetical protein
MGVQSFSKKGKGPPLPFLENKKNQKYIKKYKKKIKKIKKVPYLFLKL